jgi:hypothetical protein
MTQDENSLALDEVSPEQALRGGGLPFTRALSSPT